MPHDIELSHITDDLEQVSLSSDSSHHHNKEKYSTEKIPWRAFVQVDSSDIRIWVVFGIIAGAVFFGLLAALVQPEGSVSSTSSPSYQMWCIGNCNIDVTTSTTPGAVLMGGGNDVTEAFEWQITNANRGDFLVLRTSGEDGYNQWVYNISVSLNMTLNSVRTILFLNGDASYDTVVQNYITNAEAIFFAGGDQSLYINYWVGTPIQTIINNKLKSITIGGTSAGCAILGGRAVFAAEYGSVISSEAMMNPFDQKITITNPFVNIPDIGTVITDTHFKTRNRMGRMLTFVARIVSNTVSALSNSMSFEPNSLDYNVMSQDYTFNTHGVGIDERTALLLNRSTGIATAVGYSTAYICSATMQPICDPNLPLTFKNVSCFEVNALKNDKYDFKKLRKISGNSYNNTIQNGEFTNSNHYGNSTFSVAYGDYYYSFF